MVVRVRLPPGPLVDCFKLQPLPLTYFSWPLVILLAYSALTTTLKQVCIRRFGWQ